MVLLTLTSACKIKLLLSVNNLILKNGAVYNYTYIPWRLAMLPISGGILPERLLTSR